MNPVKLACKDLLPKNAARKATAHGHLCIAHGLLGNAMNFATVGRYLSQNSLLQDKIASITSLDMRNHGASPHTPVHSNAVMASDIEKFILEQSASSLPATHQQVVMGHSMGGLALIGMLLRRYNEDALLPTEESDEKSLADKFCSWEPQDCKNVCAAMRLLNKDAGFSDTFPLQSTLFRCPDNASTSTRAAISAAVIVDITPTIVVDNTIRDTLRDLCKVNLASVHSYDDAQKELIRVGMDNKSMRDFYTTNLIIGRGTKPSAWRCNLPVLSQQVDSIRPTIVQWFENYKKTSSGLKPKACTLPVLFVFGSESIYNVRENIDLISEFFPNSQVKVVKGAGHFVHHEKPVEFTEAVAPFIASHI